MVRLGEKTIDVASATLEVFHLFADEASWVLEAVLVDGSRVSLEGRARTPVLPGPSELVVAYVDAPRVITLDGQHGTLAAPGAPGAPRLRCTELAGGRAHLAGTLTLVWTAVADGATRPFEVELAADAALIT